MFSLRVAKTLVFWPILRSSPAQEMVPSIYVIEGYKPRSHQSTSPRIVLGDLEVVSPFASPLCLRDVQKLAWKIEISWNIKYPLSLFQIDHGKYRSRLVWLVADEHQNCPAHLPGTQQHEGNPHEQHQKEHWMCDVCVGNTDQLISTGCVTIPKWWIPSFQHHMAMHTAYGQSFVGNYIAIKLPPHSWPIPFLCEHLQQCDHGPWQITWCSTNESLVGWSLLSFLLWIPPIEHSSKALLS